MKTTVTVVMPDDIQLALSVYIDILKVEDVGERIKLQATYCKLRDYVAKDMNLSPRTIQECCEEQALHEKMGEFNSFFDRKTGKVTIGNIY